MKLFLAIFALATTTLTAPSGRAAAAPTLIDFALSGAKKDRLQLALHRGRSDRHHLSIGLRPAELAGLEEARLQGDAASPIRFTLQREAGRLDCAGTGGEQQARGTCRFTDDPSFASFLATAGMTRPTDEQMLAMTAVNVRRELVQGLKNARFAMPTPPDLIAMSAVGVTAHYVRDLGAVGFRPLKSADLIPLKALDVSPAYIASLTRAGYARLSASELIQLKALGVTADFIADLQRRGFRNPTVSRLVQLKALGITPYELDRLGRVHNAPTTRGRF